MSYDIRDLSYSDFAEKITHLADEHKVGAPVMIGACLMILRGLYASLPMEMKYGFCFQLHRFVNELEAQNPRIAR